MVRKEHAAPYGMQLDSGFDGTDLWKSSFPDVSRPLFAPWGYLKPNPQQQWRGGKQRAAVVMTASTAAADSIKLCVLINTKVIPVLEALRHCPALTLCRGGKFRGLCSVGGGFQHTLLLPGGSCSWAEHWELHGWETCSPSTRRLQGTEKASGAEVWRAGLRDGEIKGRRAPFQCNLYSQRQKGAG